MQGPDGTLHRSRDEPGPIGAGGRSRGRWWICVAAVVVVLVVGAVVLAGSHQDHHAAGPASTGKSAQAGSPSEAGNPTTGGNTVPVSASIGGEGPANGVRSSQAPTALSAAAPAGSPPAADVSIRNCQAEPGNRARVIVEGTIVNHDTQTDDYTIIVSIEDGGQSVGEAFDTENAVAAGETSTWSAQGELGGQTGTGLTCTLAWLHRTASD